MTLAGNRRLTEESDLPCIEAEFFFFVFVYLRCFHDDDDIDDNQLNLTAKLNKRHEVRTVKNERM